MILLRYRRILLPLLAGVVGWLTALEPPDLYLFGQFGTKILTGHLDQVYASSWNQAGPLQLVLSRGLLLGSSGHQPAAIVIALIDAAMTLGAMRLCQDRNLEVALGITALIWFALPQPWNGHPIELFIALAWLGSTALLRRDRWISAALVMALGVAVAPWAVLGVPVLLSVPGFWRAVRTGALAGLIALACYLPFVLTGHFELFSHVWPVSPFSGVHQVFPHLQRAGWSLRLGQAVLVGGGCAAFAWFFRGKPTGYYLAPFVAAVVRVATDPVVFSYYWTSVAVIGVFAVARMDWQRPASRWIAVAGLIYLPWEMAAAGRGGPLFGGVAALVAMAGLLAYDHGRRVRSVSIRDDAEYGVPAHAG